MTYALAVVLAAILSLAPSRLDRHETIEQRTELVSPVAAAIAAVTDNPEWQAYLVAQADHETKLARYVLEGRCQDGPKGEQCDPDRNGVPQSVGPWQTKPKYCEGAATLEGQAMCILKIARGGRALCGTWEGAFAAQGGLPVCTTKTSQARVATMQRVLKKIHVERQRQRAK